MIPVQSIPSIPLIPVEAPITRPGANRHNHEFDLNGKTIISSRTVTGAVVVLTGIVYGVYTDLAISRNSPDYTVSLISSLSLLILGLGIMAVDQVSHCRARQSRAEANNQPTSSAV